MAELKRTSAFDRSLLIVSAPAGTGYVNTLPMEVADFATLGDSASVAVQYARLPSLLALQQTPSGAEHHRLLLAAIRDRFRPASVLALAAALIPAMVLPIHFVVSRWHPPVHEATSSAVWTDLFGISLLFSFNRVSLILGWALAGLIAALGVTTLLRESLTRRGSGSETGSARGWRWRGRPEDGFALVAVIFAVGWFLTPDIVAGGSFMRERISIYPVIILLGWLTVRLGARGRTGVILLATVITTAQVVLPLPKQAAASRGVADFVAGSAHVPPGETVLPINFFSHVGQPRSRISTLLHPVGYYTLAGGIGLYNYEAETSYFPIRYRPGKSPQISIGGIQSLMAEVTPWRYPTPVDWIVARYPAKHLVHWPLVYQKNRVARWMVRHYESVHKQGETWLLRRKPGPWPPPPPQPQPTAPLPREAGSAPAK